MARRLLHALPIAAACALAASTAALGAGRSTTHLLSETPQGTFPNGLSFDAAISRDRQVARLAAYDSMASDIVPGDVNGVRDVFVVHRAEPYDRNPKVGNGSEWIAGQTDLVSTGLGGQPANGPSWGPDLDGDQTHIPHCVAFLSAASNLVPNDTNGKVDAFVKDLTTGKVTDVSVNSFGQQANGDTYDVKIDGACDRVAFTSDASNLALTAAAPKLAAKRAATNACAKAAKHGRKKRRRKKGKKRVCAAAPTGTTRAVAVTTAPPPGTKQVYVRILDNSQDDNHGLAGTTFLASASNTGQAGNGNSYEVSFGKLSAGCPRHCGSMSGDAVAFTSDATNLAPGDNNGQPDVYERTFILPAMSWQQRRAGRAPVIQMRTRLVSAGPNGQAGNGASDQPSIDDAGDVVAFRTAATDLLPGDTNGVTDVALAHTDSSPPRLDWVSRTGGVIGNGASSHPSVARAGSPLVFQTDANNLNGSSGDSNCVSDILFWNIVNRLSLPVSNDSEGHPSGSPSWGLTSCPAVHTSPAENPVGSYYTNYIAFEDSNPLLDIPVGDRVFPGLSSDPVRAARLAASEPSLHQVYMHFIYTP